MKKVIVFICVLLPLIFQVSSAMIVLLKFYADQNRIAREECRNRFDLIPVCNGMCVLKRELQENENSQPITIDVRVKQVNYVKPTCFCFNLKVCALDTKLEYRHPLNENVKDQHVINRLFRPPLCA